MHWLKKYRMDNRLSREQLAAKIRKPARPNRPETGIGCSAVLIEILESGDPKRGITHPEIANRIAEVTGATAEQRDSIVHQKHRGTWTPRLRKKAEIKKEEKVRHFSGNVSPNARKVVRIARGGYETGRYESQSMAAMATGCTTMTVHNRCTRKLKPGTEEFSMYGCTFRYADEWDAMDERARMADLGFKRI